MEQSIHEIQITTRIHHKRTIKEGWSCDETSVTVSIPYKDWGRMDPHALMTAELYAAHQAGLEEAERRNAQEGRS